MNDRRSSMKPRPETIFTPQRTRATWVVVEYEGDDCCTVEFVHRNYTPSGELILICHRTFVLWQPFEVKMQRLALTIMRISGSVVTIPAWNGWTFLYAR